jgi:hypothetical protein
MDPDRSSGSWFTLLLTPSRRAIRLSQWLPVSFVPTYSGGTAGVFHPFP